MDNFSLPMRSRSLPSTRGSPWGDWFAVYRKICRRASRVDWSWRRQESNVSSIKSFAISFQLTMCVLTANDRSSDHHDEFGIFACHSFLLKRRSLATVPSMFQWRTGEAWHVQLDQNCATLARTIESEINVRISIDWKFISTLNSPESTLPDICGTRCWFGDLRCQCWADLKWAVQALVRWRSKSIASGWCRRSLPKMRWAWKIKFNFSSCRTLNRTFIFTVAWWNRSS